MTEFDELAQVLIIDMSVISIINTHAKRRQSHQIQSYLLLQNQVCFWSITNTTIFSLEFKYIIFHYPRNFDE